jgi:hypothetical protein
LASTKRHISYPVTGFTQRYPESEYLTLAAYPVLSLPRGRPRLLLHQLFDGFTLRIASGQRGHFGPEATFRVFVNHRRISFHAPIFAHLSPVTGYPNLAVVAFPLGVVGALIGKANPKSTLLYSEVQVEVFSARFQAHPPVVVRHLLQTNGRPLRHNLVESGSAIGQFTLRSDLNRASVLLPNHEVMIGEAGTLNNPRRRVSRTPCGNL